MSRLSFSLFVLLNLAAAVLGADKFSRDDFPPDFVFGSGTSAYQVEGAADQDGRKPSIWDTFTHSGKMHEATGDIACDEYHRYKEDVKLMVDAGLEAYRFSISWSRLVPNGRGPVNAKGLEYYNNLINELISNGIQPHVTLHHSDLPQALEDEYGGWVSRKIVKDFTAYADLCFRKFGDRVSHWTTMNEANVFVLGGYDGGYLPPRHCSPPFGVNCTRGNSTTEPYLASHYILLAHASAATLYREKYQYELISNGMKIVPSVAKSRKFGDRVSHWTTMNEANVFVLGGYDGGYLPPRHCSPPFGVNCTRGNSTTEPYLASHYILLAHASAATLYREKYQDKQHGFIGINLFALWVLPLTNAIEDVIAAQRAKDFMLGWYMDPLVYGDYPNVMKKNVGSRLPAFTKLESNQVKGSFDFIGVNYYLSVYVKDNSRKLEMEVRNFDADMAVDIAPIQNGTSAFEYAVMPWALQEVLEYFKQVYGNPPIYIHENGQVTPHNSSLEDWSRVKYLHGHIGGLLDALRNGSNARGYFEWSFLDLFELLGGYEMSFGLYHVDMDDPDLKRQPKLSAHWYSHFLKRKGVSSDGFIELGKNLSALSHASSLQ
ncbi:Beta-glucosidase 11 [Morella rubra]|uniref:Beta-glucosidase 11 n=1 Tax=Morella rubra TaxID=262757 RepID=A0A6A1VNU1_9ROSI|nr:Beta-glucosidase 11 [Morella rubra]